MITYKIIRFRDLLDEMLYTASKKYKWFMK